MRLKSFIISCILFLLVHTIYGQFVPITNCPVIKINSGNPAFPFPQFLEYAAGKTLAKYNAEGVTHADMEKTMREAYEIMSHRCRMTGQTYCGVPYINFNNGTVPHNYNTFVSEGDGYMLIAAAMFADQPTFNGLWMWIHDNRLSKVVKYKDCQPLRPTQKTGEFIAGWKCDETTAANNGDTHSASDGDFDIAMGLLIAYKQWGEFMYHNGTLVKDACGNPISLKLAAEKAIKALVDTIPDIMDNGAFAGYMSGVIGVDGYVKSGNTWGELTMWRATQNTYPWAKSLPTLGGNYGAHYIDYNSPGYFNQFAKFLTTEGNGNTWQINQLKRAEASSDFLVNEAYKKGYIASIGKVYCTTDGTFTFGSFNSGEDFRFAWKNLISYMWHGNPTTSWDPVTHQVKAGGNTFEKDMAIRHAAMLREPKAGTTVRCKKMGASPDPGQPLWWGVAQIPQSWDLSGNILEQAGSNYALGAGATAAVASEDMELIADMYRQSELVWDDASTESKNLTDDQRYIQSTPKYFHGIFRVLGLLVNSGNMHAPENMVPAANMKVYMSVDKTYAYQTDNIAYTVQYRNYGSKDATGVTITTPLDADYTFVSANKGGVYNAATKTITWNIGTVKGFKSGGLAATIDSVSFVVNVKDTLNKRVCLQSTITSTNCASWVSNEYPNHATYTMERNCVDILANRTLIVKKTANRKDMNPNDIVKFTIDFENKSTADAWLNGGRSNVYMSYGNYLPAINDNGDWANTSFYQFYRFWHDGSEAYINMNNYRVSYFMNDINKGFKSATNPNGWLFGVDNQNDMDKYGYNPTTGPITFAYQKIPAGEDAFGKWNQRIMIRFANTLTAPATHVYDKLDSKYLLHKGVFGPGFIRSRLYTDPATNMKAKVSDDWSYASKLQNIDLAAQGSLFFPISPGWAENANPNKVINNYARHSCSPNTDNYDRILVEEFDGYTWRRIQGRGPLPGKEAYDVVIVDTIPKQLKWKGFIDSLALTKYATYTAAAASAPYTGIVKWTIPEMLVGESGNLIYEAIAADIGCPSAADVKFANAAWIYSQTDSPDSSKVALKTTCAELPPIIDPQTSLFKTANKTSVTTGDIVTYKLKYINTSGTTTVGNLSTQTGWRKLGSGNLPKAQGYFSGDPNANSGVAAPYFYANDRSYGINGTFETTWDCGNSSIFYLAFRYTSGTPDAADFKGISLKVTPLPAGQGTIKFEVKDGTTVVATETANTSYPTNSAGTFNPINIKVKILDNKMYVYVNDTETVLKTYPGLLTTTAGYVGVYSGPSGNQQKMTYYKTAFDYAFDITLFDKLPTELGNVTTISNSGTWNSTSNVVTWPIVPGPFKAKDSLVYTFNAKVNTCSKFINNLGMATVYGKDTLKTLLSVSCSSTPLCSAPTSVSITPSPTGSVCEGSTVTLTAAAAPTGTWTYAFKKGTTVVQTSTTLTTYNANTTGNYTVVAYDTKDSATCSRASAIATVTINPLPTVTAAASPTTVCKGASATITAGGASTYAWDNGLGSGATKTVTPTANTTYKVTGTDGNGCSNTAQVVVSVANLPTIAASATPTIVCSGQTASISATGGTSYSWSGTLGSGTPKTVTPTSTTTYTVTGSDGTCSNTANVVVTVTPMPTVTLTASPASICVGAVATLTASGASSYAWSGGLPAGTSNTVTPSANTTYTVTGTANGCIGTASASVSLYPVPTISISATPTMVCSGSSTTLTASGGTSYIWSGGLGSTVSVTATPTVATTYTVTGVDGNSCRGTATIAVGFTNPPAPTAVNVSVSVGGTVPALTATGTGTIKWYDDSGTTLLFTGASFTPSVSTASVATFPYKVSNTVNGCESAKVGDTLFVTACTVTAPTVTPLTQTICVGDPASAFTATGTNLKWYGTNPTPVLATTASYTPTVTATTDFYVSQTNLCEGPKTKVTITVNPLPTVTATASPAAICKGGSTTITAAGADKYAWSNTSTLQSQILSPTITTTYTVTGTDLNVCRNTASVIVTVHNLPTITASASPANVCSGGTTSLTASGGSSYVWSGSLGNTATVTATPVAASTYTVTGTDANSCVGTAQVAVSYTVPALPTVTSVTVNIGAAIPTLTASGTLITWYADNKTTKLGTGPSFVPAISTAANAIFTFYVTNTVSGCESGFETVTVTVNGCTTVAPTVAPTVETCQGTAFAPVAATGTGTMKWYDSPSGTNVIATTMAYTPTAAGDYYVAQTDVCEGPRAKVTAVIHPLPTFSISAVPTVICAGESTILTASPASGYTYSWNNAFTGTSQTLSPASTTTYSVTASNSFTCKQTASIIVVVNPLPTVSATPAANSVCSGLSTTIQATGATSYAWSNGLPATALVTVSPTVTTTYSVTGTTNGCASTASVVVNTFPVTSTAISASDASVCLGKQSTLTASGSGTYAWSTGATGSSIVVTPAIATTYTVTGTDGNSCVSTGTFAIAVKALPTVTIAATKSAVCLGSSTTLQASGAYTYLWSDALGSQPTAVVTPTATTSYVVTGTDAQSCENTASIAIQTYSLPTATLTGGGSYCTSIPAVVAQVTGGKANYKITYFTDGTNPFTLSGITGSTNLPIVSDGIYEIIAVEDANGCTSQSYPPAITVSKNGSATYTIGGDGTYCKGDARNPVSINITSLDGPWSVVYNDGTADHTVPVAVGALPYTIANPDAGIYTVKQITNKDNCVAQGDASKKATVVVNDTTIVAITGLSATLCDNGKAVTLAVSPAAASGETAIFSSVTGGISGNKYFPAQSGGAGNKTIVVTFTNANGCVSSASSSVSVLTSPVASIAGAPGYGVCYGMDQIIDASHTNTTAPYSFGWYLSNTLLTADNIEDPTFKAGAAIGIYPLEYIVTDGNGCKDTAKISIEVKNKTKPKWLGTLPELCTNNASIDLKDYVTPFDANGSFTINGTPAASTIIDPKTMTAGPYSIVYTYAMGSCSDSEDTVLTIKATPTVSLGSYQTEFCEYTPAYTFTSLSPSTGGVLSGTGVSGLSFNPALATTKDAAFNLTYTVTQNGCVDSKPVPVTVWSAPVVSFNLPTTACAKDAGINLLGLVNPTTGTFAMADGLNGTYFYPKAVTGYGSAIAIDYTVTAHGCSTKVTKSITVHKTAVPSVRDTSAIIPVTTVPPVTATGTALTLYSGSYTVLDAAWNGSYANPANTTAGVYPYFVTQTLNGCQSDSVPVKLTITNCKAATPTGISASQCFGDAPGSLSATGLSQADMVYHWFNNTTFTGTVGATLPMAAGLAVGKYSYYVKIYDTVEACYGAASQPVVYEVKALPSITFAPDTIMCENNAVQNLSAKTLPATATFWLGATQISDFNPAGKVGINTIEVRYTDPVSSCKNTTTGIVRVKNLPVLSFPLASKVCANGTVIPLNATPSGGVYFGGPLEANGTSINPKNIALNTPTTYKYRYTDAQGCSDTIEAVITGYDSTKVSIQLPGGKSKLCEKSTAISLGASISGGTFTVNNTANTGTFDPAIAGNYTVVYNYTNADGCTSSDKTIITVTPLPTVAHTIASANLAVCSNGGPVSLTGTPSGLIFTGTGVSSSMVGYTFNPKTATIGNNTITYSYTDANACSNSSTVVIDVQDIQKPTVADQSFFSFNYPKTIVATGTGLSWYGSKGDKTDKIISATMLTNADLKAKNYKDSLNNAGSYIFHVTQTVGQCESDPAPFTVTISNCTAQPPVIANTGVSSCYGEAFSAITVSSHPKGDHTIWYDANKKPIGIGNSFTPSATTLANAKGPSFIYAADTLAGEGCRSTMVQITYTVNFVDVPTVTAPNPQCEGAVSGKLSATGNGGSFAWFIGGKSFSGSDLTLASAGVAAGSANPYIFKTIQIKGACHSDTVYKNVTISPLPSKPTLPSSFEVCYKQPINDIEAVASGAITWYSLPNKTVAAQGKILQGSTVKNTVGSHSYYAVTFDGACTSDTALFTYSIKKLPALPNTKDEYKCSTSSIIPPLSASVETGAITQWFSDISLQTKVMEATSFTSPAADVTYYVAANLNNCQGPAKAVKVATYTVPMPTIKVSSVAICEGESTTLSATGLDIKWYDYNKSFLTQAPSYKYTWTTPGTRVFYATQRGMTPDGITSCTSDFRTSDVITDKAVPQKLQVANITVCDNLPMEQFESNYTGTGTVIWQNAAGVNVASGYTFTPAKKDLVIGDFNPYSATLLENGCYGPATKMYYVIRKAVPKPVISQSPSPLCLGKGDTLSLNIASSLPYTWLDSTNNITSREEIVAMVTKPGRYKVKAFTQQGYCNSDTVLLTIGAFATPTPVLTGKDSLCIGSYGVVYNLDESSQSSSSSFAWHITGDRVMYSTDNTKMYRRAADFVTPGIDTISVTETSRDGCSATASVVVRIADRPHASFVEDNPGQEGSVLFFNNSEQDPIVDGTHVDSIGLSYKWHFGRANDVFVDLPDTIGTLANPIKKDYEYGNWKISLKATNDFGCSASFEKTIFVDINTGLYIPNTIVPESPAADLRLFKPVGFNLKSYKIWIYDTWGNLLWYSDKLLNGAPAEGWDGKANGEILKCDTYIWKIDAEFLNNKQWKGNKQDNGTFSKFGNILLLR